MPTDLSKPTESPPERSRPRFEFKLSASDAAAVNGGLQAIAHQKRCDALVSAALAGSVDGVPIPPKRCFQQLLAARIEFEENATPEARAASRRMQAHREEQNRRTSGPHDGSLASALCVRRPTTNRQRASFRGTTRALRSTPTRRAAGIRRTASATASPSSPDEAEPPARRHSHHGLDLTAVERGVRMVEVGPGTYAAQRELDAHARVLEGVAS